jgi:hypothetical protein
MKHFWRGKIKFVGAGVVALMFFALLVHSAHRHGTADSPRLESACAVCKISSSSEKCLGVKAATPTVALQEFSGLSPFKQILFFFSPGKSGPIRAPPCYS